MALQDFQDFQVLQRGIDGTAHGLSVGGPYTAEGARYVLVGDLWVLAGQSNMEGVADLVDVETPSPWVHSFQSRERWGLAEEPLHWLGESPHLVHHRLWGRPAVPSRPDPRDPNRAKGAGLGLAFGKAYHAATGVPVGLIPSAHGGTSMGQWDPARREEGGASLYGATYARVRSVGGRVRGILWYQGESDANPADAQRYADRMTALVQAFRSDLDQPDLPFYFVQLGCFAYGPTVDALAGWNGVREAQRLWATTLPHVQMVSAIDLELDDAIHIGTHGLKRLGRRLAAVATGRSAPVLSGITQEAGSRLRVTFDHVPGGLQAPGRPTGFSIRDAQGREVPAIYKTTLDGASALLHLSVGEVVLPPGASLYYGYGLAPYCNITDAEDQAVPAFGPIPFQLP